MTESKQLNQNISTDTDPIFIVVDLFCGFGGTTEGFENAEMSTDSIKDLAFKAMGTNRLGGSQLGYNEKFKIAKVIACVNHDPKALKSHLLNHPDVAHFEEDIRTLNLDKLIEIVNYWKRIYPNALLILWASLECTNFSKAKGGQARDADSRTLAEHLDRYILALDPDYIQIENVVEFMSWGPLDDNGKPVSRKNGTDWMRWRKEINEMGYRDEWKELNSANFGAYTSRNMLFGIFAKPDLPIAWPAATHSKNPSKSGMYGDLKKWKAVKEVLDFTDEGESIFNRKKELSPKTLERVYAGLVKYVALGDTSFLSNYKSGDPASKNSSVDSPSGTLTTVPTQAVVQTSFLTQRNGGEPTSKIVSIDGPSRTLTATGGNQDIVQPEFMIKYNSMGKDGTYNPPSVNEPCPVIATQNRLGIVQPEFIAAYYGNGDNVSSVSNPCPTIPTKDRFGLVQPVCLLKYDSTDKTGTHYPPSLDNPCPVIIAQARLGLINAEFMVNYNHSSQCADVNEPAPTILTHDKLALAQPSFFIDRQFSSGGRNSSIENPAGAVMPVPKMSLVEAAPFIMSTAYNNLPKSIEEPCQTLTASRHHHYIINPGWFGNPGSIDEPCFTIVARQDKSPLYVASAYAVGEKVSIVIYEKDSEIMRKIKYFMAHFSIIDIKMRMLRVLELLLIQGFPADYKMFGNQTDHKKHIGNSVVPIVPKSMIVSLATKVIEMMKLKAAA